MLPLEAARLKVRDIIDRNPQRGYGEIVERWRQRSDGLDTRTSIVRPLESNRCQAGLPR